MCFRVAVAGTLMTGGLNVARAHDVSPVAGESAPQTAPDDIRITHPSAILVGENKSIAALFMTITNHGGTVHLIDGVSSHDCSDLAASSGPQEPGETEEALFTHLALPANTTLVFPSSGFHLVCHGLGGRNDTTPTTADAPTPSEVTVVFHYRGGSSSTVVFPIAKA
ncbi:hypothetical protein AA103196_2083 [Ameyamaea chiangmaiensis NBRC 103196]|nr:hypothetical protein AA103196_2083 [Ameyamaea chiangmaiensis NBRC 103196]